MTDSCKPISSVTKTFVQQTFSKGKWMYMYFQERQSCLRSIFSNFKRICSYMNELALHDRRKVNRNDCKFFPRREDPAIRIQIQKLNLFLVVVALLKMTAGTLKINPIMFIMLQVRLVRALIFHPMVWRRQTDMGLHCKILCCRTTYCTNICVKCY